MPKVADGSFRHAVCAVGNGDHLGGSSRAEWADLWTAGYSVVSIWTSTGDQANDKVIVAQDPPAGTVAEHCRQAPGLLSCRAVAFAADRRLPALDADLPERRDHVVCCSLGHLNKREAIGDLDRADLPA